MALLTEQREPEMARFIDTYKFEQDKATRRDRFGGGTSLPLDSDGYEDKQRVLREERHKDWLQQQDKPRDPVYYRVGTPEEGFLGLGEYEKRRHEMNVIRQKEYNDLLRKQREMEHQKLEARRHQSPPRPAQPPGAQLDYHIQSEKARAEEKRAYQDYMGKYQYPSNVQQKPAIDYEENKRLLNEERKREYNQLMEKKAKEERYWAMRGRPVTPPGGLNIGNYDRQVKETAAQKKKEYKEMLDQQKNEQLKLRAMDREADVSPKYTKYRDQERPLVGSPRDVNYYRQEKEAKDKFRKDLKSRPNQDYSPPAENFGTEQTPEDADSNLKAFLEVEKEKAMNKRKYAEELLKQQREHMYLRARQEPEVPVLDRNAQPSNYLANKPPPGPGYTRARDEPHYQTPTFWNEGRQAGGPRSYDSDVSRSNQSSGIPVAEDRRRQDDMKHQQQQSSKPAEVVKNPFYSSDDYEKFQREIQRKQAEDYKDFLAKKNAEVKHRDWNYEQNGILELRGDDAVQSKQRELRAERQRDYNNYMSQMKPSSNRIWPEPDGRGALLVKHGEYENVRHMYDEERKRDYVNSMQKRREQRVSNPSRRHEFVDTASGPYGGLFHGLGEHGNRSDVLNKERQQEYNDLLTQQYGKDRPSGRPNWVKESIPNDKDRGRSPMRNPPPTDHYQQMLDEKRREEANRRRYDDPEYQGRLGQGRDRGEAGQRLGY